MSQPLGIGQPLQSMDEIADSLGAQRHFLDRRESLVGEELSEMVVVLKGCAIVFALRDGHDRRHRVGVLEPGSAIIGPVSNMLLVPVHDLEFARIPKARLAALANDSPQADGLRAGIAATLAACGGSLAQGKTTPIALSAACARCASEMQRRCAGVTEAAYSRHLRRLVATASATLSFEQRLRGVLGKRARAGALDLPDDRLPPIVRACTQIALSMGCDPESIPNRIPRDTTRKPEQIFAHVAALGIRPVFLDPGWWNSGVGALLAFRAEDQSPVALIPSKNGFVAFVHSAGATVGPVQVDAAFASELGGTASQFHPTLAHEAVSLRKFIQFAVRGSERDFVRAVIVTGIGTLVSLAIPIATGLLVAEVLPGNNRLALFFLGLVLLGTTLCSAACSFVVANLLLRSETRMGNRALGGILDRCLRMPVHVLRQFTSGDLADRILSVGDVQSVLSGAGVSAIIAGVFSILYLVIMLSVNPTAGIVGAGLLLVAVLFSIGISISRARISTAMMEGQGRLSSMVLQFIGGIDTIRSASAEQFATMRWLNRFRQIRASTMQTRTMDRVFDVFAAAFPVACMMIFWVQFIPVDDAGKLLQAHAIAAPARVAQYLVFNSAFVTALYSVLELGERLGDLASLRSTLGRIGPILSAPTEHMGDREQPGVLSGSIELDDVHFTYPGSANEVLQGVSISVAPGEAIAVVGHSGSGKSTLLQLMLGLRSPSLGSVMYDGKALDRLDPVSVRRQIGAVVQSTRVIPGSILDNIVGSTLFSPKDAERAIEAAGFADEVDQMPMGLHTYVTDQTLSGGQVQKLMIARAMVTRPKILIFDEATSALDEISQAQVVRSLKALKATRIIVAHRLSTIRTVDRIYVMDSGKVVQQGSFEELLHQDGPFKEMARRQLLDSEDSTAI